MNREKWDIVIENIDRDFNVLDRGVDEDNGKKIEWIEFENPAGKIRLEWIEKPRIVGLRTEYSRRAGTFAGNIKQLASKSEKVNFVRAYKFDEEKDDWVEMKAQRLIS